VCKNFQGPYHPDIRAEKELMIKPLFLERKGLYLDSLPIAAADH
jgi:hypothetical protein